jgi:hypothetical protein
MTMIYREFDIVSDFCLLLDRFKLEHRTDLRKFFSVWLSSIHNCMALPLLAHVDMLL